MRRTCVWVSAFKNSVIHKTEFLQPFGYVGMTRISPYLLVILIFIWFFGFWLAWSTTLLKFQKSTVLTLPVHTFTWHNCGCPRSCLSTLSLDTVEDVMGGEVDELEEDVGWSISYLESVMDVEEDDWRRTCWQAWNNDRNEVLCVAL